MKKFLSIALLTTLAFSQTIYLKKGWNLVGSTDAVDVLSIKNDNIKIMWRWNYGKWQAYSENENIKKALNEKNISEFTFTNPGEGFWVYANEDSILTLPDNINSNKYFTFYNTLHSVDASVLANKTFKFYIYGEKQLISFDENAEATYDYDSHSCSENDDNTTGHISVENGMLKVINKKNEGRFYKVLAQNENGIVFGAIDIGDKDYVEQKVGTLEPVIFFINENISENPQNMQDKIPYKTYYTWSDGYVFYETNGSVVMVKNYGVAGENTTYEIADGKIIEIDYKNSDEYGWKHEAKIQTIYTIKNFDINKIEFNDFHYESVIGYEDINGSWHELNLSANPDIDTWQELFNETNWTLYGNKFYENNFTTKYGETFTISDDGKTLTVKYCDGYEFNQTIKDGKIIEKHNGERIDIVSNGVPTFIKLNTNNKILNKKVYKNAHMPIYLKKYLHLRHY